MYSSKLKKILFTVFCAVFALTVIGAFATFASKTYAQPATYTFAMNDGAEVRTDVVAIRFTSSMNKSELDALIAEGKEVKIFTVITPTRYLNSKSVNDSANFTKAKLDEAGVSYVSVEFSRQKENLTALTDESGENYVYRACLYNVQEHNISKAFSARSYLEIDGEIVQYTDYSEAANSRSVYYVAQVAKDNGNTDEAVAALCANFTVTVNSEYAGTKEITVKRGERLSEYAENENVRALTIENLAYLKGYTLGENAYDANSCITKDITLTAQYAAVRFGIDGNNAYVSGCDGDYKNYSDAIVIPSVYAGKPVTFVRNGAFAENYNIKRVILPESVIRLDGCVFQNCRNLEYVSMTGITDMAFKNLGTSGIYADETEDVITNNNFLNCGKLTVLVVNKKFNLYADNTGAQQFKITDEKLSACINIYVAGSEAESQVNCAPSGANDLLTGKVYYKGDVNSCEMWNYDESGNIVLKYPSHNFVNGKCENCGVYNTQGVKYEYDEASDCYYVGENKTLNVSELIILSAYDDGTHGELPVKYVAFEAFKGNAYVKKVVFPESVEHLRGGAFLECGNLEFVSMVGVKSLTFAVDMDNNFRLCGKLKTVIVGDGFTTNCGQFNGEEAKTTDIYVNGTTAPKFVGNNNILSGNVYYKGDLSRCGQWKFDENGNFVTSESMAHNFVNGKCEYCGEFDTQGVKYEYDSASDCYYVGDNKTLNVEEVTILSAYDDGTHGELPVKYVAFEAFKYNGNIKKVILPESVEHLRGGAFLECGNLEFVSMIGIKSLTYAVDMDNNFRLCGKLKTVIVGDGFTTNCGQFNGEEAKTTDIYVYGTTAATFEGNNNTLSGNVYYYSEENAENCWHYVGGIPSLW